MPAAIVISIIRLIRERKTITKDGDTRRTKYDSHPLSLLPSPLSPFPSAKKTKSKKGRCYLYDTQGMTTPPSPHLITLLSSPLSLCDCTTSKVLEPSLSSPHLTSPHLTSPHLTSPHLTPPHLTSPRPFHLLCPSPHIHVYHRSHMAECILPDHNCMR